MLMELQRDQNERGKLCGFRHEISIYTVSSFERTAFELQRYAVDILSTGCYPDNFDYT